MNGWEGRTRMTMPEDKEFCAIYRRVMDRWIAASDASRLTADEQDFIAIATLLNENANGSLSQYFENSYGEFALRAVAALRRIGCDKAAELLSQACAVFDGGRGPRADRDERSAQMDALSDEQWERLGELSEALEAEDAAVWAALGAHAARWAV